ncbi:uncharacterized protein [Drosophila kikkawai]|uniref:Uncharacterized protein isoform X11 n=1 Tax=Drosophila kikkawai TaxID=30033 RepID=A0ABM3C759_DROKI|nr:uncharacterized protein LOC108073223 isoform X4 [Drosophila kikkawai]
MRSGWHIAAQTGAAYRICAVTTDERSFLVYCLGPLVFGSILESAPAVPLAFWWTYSRCSLKDSRVSMMTPRYLIALCDRILVPPTSTLAVSTAFRLEIRTASVLWAANSRPATASHDSTAWMAVSARASTDASSFATTTIATSSANPTRLVLTGIGSLSTPSYIAFQRRGPRTEPCGTPAETLCSLGPMLVSNMSTLLLK